MIRFFEVNLDMWCRGLANEHAYLATLEECLCAVDSAGNSEISSNTQTEGVASGTYSIRH